MPALKGQKGKNLLDLTYYFHRNKIQRKKKQKCPHEASTGNEKTPSSRSRQLSLKGTATIHREGGTLRKRRGNHIVAFLDIGWGRLLNKRISHGLVI